MDQLGPDAGQTAVIRFPPRRVAAIIICKEPNGDGWLTIAGAHGWLFASRAEARAEAQWLSNNLGLTIREVSAMTDIDVDVHQVHEFVATYIAQARTATGDLEQPGVLQILLIDPANEDVSIRRYHLDDASVAEKIAKDAISASRRGCNVYAEARTVRPDLKGKNRGKAEDTIAVFALTVDSDADKGLAWTPTVPVSLTVETSPGNAHHWFFLEKAVTPDDAKQIGERLKAAIGGDHDTGVITQPYRLAGTVNYPSKAKRERGRTVAATRVVEFDPEVLWTPERFEQEFPPASKPNGGGPADEDEAGIPADTLAIIRQWDKDDRSSAFYNVVRVLKARGFTLDGIVALFARYPDGIAAKYRGRLQHEIERIWRKLAGDQPQQRHFQLKPFTDIKVLTSPNYLVKGILPRSGLVVVWGPPKCGKSFWTYDVVMHVAIGRDYRGHRVKQGAVVYAALEGGSGFARRVEAWRRLNLPDDQQHQPVPFFLLDVPVDLVADRDALIESIRDQLNGAPAVVVIDTLNRAIVGDENKSDDMAKFIRAADAIRIAFDSQVIVVHHCGTAGNRPRGHTSLSGADDAQIAIERDKEGILVAKVEHMKEGEAGAVLASKLERVELGTDDDGEEISSCVVVPTETVAAGVKLSKVQKFAYELLLKLIKTEGVDPPAEAELPKGFRVCLADIWRKRFYETYPAEKQNTKKKALLRATLDLEDAKLIELWREYVWPKRDN
jgi:hypothetical protein